MSTAIRATGYLRLHQIIGDPRAKPPVPALIPVSKSTWWSGVRSGRYPKPTRLLGARITAWSVESILALIDRSAPPEEDAASPVASPATRRTKRAAPGR